MLLIAKSVLLTKNVSQGNASLFSIFCLPFQRFVRVIRKIVMNHDPRIHAYYSRFLVRFLTMEKDATIIGTREGCYIACLDEDKVSIGCNEECAGCALDCRVLLDREQRLESGRRVLADIQERLFLYPQRFYPILAGIFIGIFLILFLIKKTLLPYYRSSWPPYLGGFFGAAIFFLLVKLNREKNKGKQNLRKGKIIRVYPPDR